MGPETSMEVQAALGSDIALVFDECTPLNVDRDYTARSTERTHRWLDRCLTWHDEHGPEASSSTGSSRAASTRTCASASAQAGRRAARRRDRDRRLARRRQAADVRGRRLGDRRAIDDARPRHLLGIGDVDDLIRGVELGIDTFDCAMPTRLGRHGVAIVPDPEQPLARRPHRRAPASESRRADHGGLPVPGLRGGHSRGYLRYLAQPARADRRAAADAPQPRLPRAAHGRPARARSPHGTLAEHAAALRAGAAP